MFDSTTTEAMAMLSSLGTTPSRIHGGIMKTRAKSASKAPRTIRAVKLDAQSARAIDLSGLVTGPSDTTVSERTNLANLVSIRKVLARRSGLSC
jgi:hypothetical protein